MKRVPIDHSTRVPNLRHSVAIILTLFSTLNLSARAQSQSVNARPKKECLIEFENITTGHLLIDFYPTASSLYKGFQTVNGIKISPYFYIGIGLGLDYYHDDPSDGFTYLPLFTNLRAVYPLAGISFYLSVSLGDGACLLEKDFKGVYTFPTGYSGFMFNVTTGASFRLNRVIAYLIGLGYKSQNVGNDYISFRSLEIETGFLF